MGIPKTEDGKILKKYKEIDRYHRLMDGAAEMLLHDLNRDGHQGRLSNASNRAIDAILTNEQAYLSGMNAIVFMYDKNSQKKVSILKRTQFVFMCLTIGVLLLVGLVIFEPASRLLIGQFREITHIASERENLVSELTGALQDVKQLEGLLPICASCKNIRDADENWTKLELYLEQNSHAEFSHSICPDCIETLYSKPPPKKG